MKEFGELLSTSMKEKKPLPRSLHPLKLASSMRDRQGHRILISSKLTQLYNLTHIQSFDVTEIKATIDEVESLKSELSSYDDIILSLLQDDDEYCECHDFSTAIDLAIIRAQQFLQLDQQSTEGSGSSSTCCCNSRNTLKYEIPQLKIPISDWGKCGSHIYWDPSSVTISHEGDYVIVSPFCILPYIFL